MSIFSTDQSLGWRLTESPVYEPEVALGIRASRKERNFAFWESPRVGFCPPVIGLNERDPDLASAIDPFVSNNNPSHTDWVTQFTTTAPNETVGYTVVATADFWWNWGDGNLEYLSPGAISHDYVVPSTYFAGIYVYPMEAP